MVYVFLDTHEVQIGGKHLRAMGLAFQDLAVDWVRELPARFGSQADDDHAWITNITVRELQGTNDLGGDDEARSGAVKQPALPTAAHGTGMRIKDGSQANVRG